MKRSARAIINLKALKHNFQVARTTAPNTKVLAVIKSNAYGHGVVESANALNDADGLAVSCIPEALELRDNAINQPILILQGHQNLEDLIAASDKNFRVVIHDETQLGYLDQLESKKVHIALKVDTGMHRLGLNPSKIPLLFQRLQRHPNVNPDIWLMTHLACADDLQSNDTNIQLDKFASTNDKLIATQSIANSAGILGWPSTHADWIRPGIMLYGSSPFSYQPNGRNKYNLRAVMTLQAPLIAKHKLEQGDSIGYGSTYQCDQAMVVGVVACGYADGYPRHAASGAPVSINGVETITLGRISMDMIVIKLHNIEAAVGDLVELWGENIDIDHVANHAETISYELLCNAGNNCMRIYKK